MITLIKKSSLQRYVKKYPSLLRRFYSYFRTYLLIVFSLLIGQATVVRWLYFVCTYNDSVTPLAKAIDHFSSSGLSSAFDTFNYDILFYILEIYFGIGGSALRLILSYFVFIHQEFKLMVLCLILQVCYVWCHRTQFWDQCIFLYLLPLGAILRHHNIG